MSSARTRRRFLKEIVAATGAAAVAAGPSAATAEEPSKRLRVAANAYPWFTFYAREGRDFNASLGRRPGRRRRQRSWTGSSRW